VAAYSAGGISLQDTINAFIVNNTVAHNDTTATLGALVMNNNSSAPQPAGIVAEQNSLALTDAVDALKLLDPTTTTIDYSVYSSAFSQPRLLLNNIIWHNRAFHLGIFTNGVTVGLLPELTFNTNTVGECGDGADYRDLGVLGSSTLSLNPLSSILTDTTGYDASNLTATDAGFVSSYCNGSRLNTPGPMLAILGTGEGGNFIDVRYGPLTPSWLANAPDYHITAGSAGVDNGATQGANVPSIDFDGDARPQGAAPDVGADEVQ
jgi:hypothetical protein